MGERVQYLEVMTDQGIRPRGRRSVWGAKSKQGNSMQRGRRDLRDGLGRKEVSRCFRPKK